jgi:hypothetical protein
LLLLVRGLVRRMMLLLLLVLMVCVVCVVFGSGAVVCVLEIVGCVVTGSISIGVY